MIRVILADDDALVLQGLSAIIASFNDIELSGTAASGREAVALCRAEHPDVALLDIRMPCLDGIQVAQTLIAEDLAAPLLLTTFDEPDLITRALEVGVRGYVLKNSPIERLHSAIITVAAGGTVFSPDVIDFIRTQVHSPGSASTSATAASATAGGTFFVRLTEREQEIAALIAEGLSNEQIAERLFLAHGTVRNHISAILEKTGLEHRTQIAVRYLAGS